MIHYAINKKVSIKYLSILFFLSLGISNQLIPIVETYESGNVKNIYYHRKRSNGIEKIKLEEYYENGFIREQGTFKDGKKDGKWIYWHENGEKRSEGKYKRGAKDGFWVGWYANGVKQGEVTWKEGKEEGLWIIWHENGEMNKELIWKDGKKNGQGKYIWNSGKTYNGLWKNGKKIN